MARVKRSHLARDIRPEWYALDDRGRATAIVEDVYITTTFSQHWTCDKGEGTPTAFLSVSLVVRSTHDGYRESLSITGPQDAITTQWHPPTNQATLRRAYAHIAEALAARRARA